MARMIDADAIDEVISTLNEQGWNITRNEYKLIGNVLFEFPTIEAEPKRDFEVVVNEACLNCELDCAEVVRCHDCSNYEETKNGCNGFCKEWNTSTYSWEWCSRGTKMDGRDNG